MVELMIMYTVFWGALIMGAIIADCITKFSTSKHSRNVPRGTHDKLTDWDKYIQQDESEV